MVTTACYVKIRQALLSVSDKTGIIELARWLITFDVEILSTGGTAKLLRENEVVATEVSTFTGFPEIMNGRVKTLHPKIHGGLLGDLYNKKHCEEMKEHAIQPINLLVVNLYPFQETAAKPDVSFNEAIEQIDIGGPAMIRSAAKNHQCVAVVVDPGDYKGLCLKLDETNGHLDLGTRRELAAKAFRHTAAYDAAIADWFSRQIGGKR